MTVILELPPEREATLQAQARARGLTVQQWLLQLAEQSSSVIDEQEEPGSGMVEENGLLVYRTGKPLPAHVVDDAIYRSREARAQHLISNS
jgi:hypothetical protein